MNSPKGENTAPTLVNTFTPIDYTTAKQAAIKAGVEALRLAVLATIPVVIDGLMQDQLNMRVIGVTFVIAILRFIDKFLHEWDGTTATGLTGF